MFLSTIFNYIKNKISSIFIKKTEDDLFDACMEGDLEELQNLIENYGFSIDHTVDAYNRSILHIASSMGNLKMVKYLKEAGANINALEVLNRSVFIHACWGGNLEVVKYLVEEAGVDIRLGNNYESRALDYASRSGSIEVLQYLIEELEFDINAVDAIGKSVLHHASQEEQIEAVKYLVKSGANVDYQCSTSGSTALHWASATRNPELVEYLVEEAGADIYIPNINGKTALVILEEMTENRRDSDFLRSYNILKSVDIKQKLITQLELTNEEVIFMDSTDYNPRIFNNRLSKIIAEKKLLMKELSEEEHNFINSDDYNPKYYNNRLSEIIAEKELLMQELSEEEHNFINSDDYNPEYYNNRLGKRIAEKKFLMNKLSDKEHNFIRSGDYNPEFAQEHEKMFKAVESLGENLQYHKTEETPFWNSEEQKIVFDASRIEPQELTREDIPEDITNVIASFLTKDDVEMLALVSRPMAKKLIEIEFKPEITESTDYSLFSPDAWFAIGHATGSFAINPGLRCVDNYMDEQAQNKTCSEYYGDTFSIDHLSSTAASYVGNYITSALSLRSINGINIQDMYIYQHYPAMLGLAVASAPVLLEMVL